jgi:hypothetical protein
VTPDPVIAGQVWVPKPHTTPGATMIRVVCRYPFHTHENEKLWVVEYRDYTEKLEKVAEKTLIESWHLAEDIPDPH